MNETLANRISGLGVAAFGAALLLWIIPTHTETVTSGWITPQTLPRACAIALILLGLWMAVIPGGAVNLDKTEAALVMLVALVSAVAVWAMGKFGFAYVAPVLAAAIIMVIGERRWPWILVGVLGAPSLIWLLVQVILNRPLP